MGIDIKFSNINHIITTGTISITLDRAFPQQDTVRLNHFRGAKYLSFYFHHFSVGG